MSSTHTETDTVRTSAVYEDTQKLHCMNWRLNEEGPEDGSSKRVSDEKESSLLHAEHYGEVEEVPLRVPWNEIRDQCI